MSNLKIKLQQNGRLMDYTNLEKHQNFYNNDDMINWINISNLEIVDDQPFKEYTNTAKFTALKESIKNFGITNPLIVNQKIENNVTRNIILSGRHRYLVAKEIGLENLPCILKRNLSDDEAQLILLDATLCQRDELLPSEKAFAYRQKMDILKRQGKRTDLITYKEDTQLSRDKVAMESGLSGATISNYIRLTFLHEQILNLIDQNKISFLVGVNLSFIPKDKQLLIVKFSNEYKIKIKSKVAKRLKNSYQQDEISFTESKIKEILMSEIPKNEVSIQDNVPFKEVYSKYFSKNFKKDAPLNEVIEVISIALEEYFSKI